MVTFQKRKNLLSVFILLLLSISCKNQLHTPVVKHQNDRISPPPITLEINVAKTCNDLKNVNADSQYKGTVYLICDSIDFYDRILQEYMLHEKYNLLMREPVNRLDTMCLRAFYDSVVINKYHKTRKEIITEINNQISAFEDVVGKYQVKKGVYYIADVYPKYPGGWTSLFFIVNSLKDSLGKGLNGNGRVMFYFTIDTTGSVNDVEIYEHLNRKADSLSSLIMKHLPDKWAPAIFNGKKVNYWMQYAIDWTQGK